MIVLRANARSNEMWVIWGFAACARFDARGFRMELGLRRWANLTKLCLWGTLIYSLSGP